MTEDRHNNWQDDESLVVGAIKKTLKAMPLEGAFYEDFQPSDETVQEFGEQLLRKTCQANLNQFFGGFVKYFHSDNYTGWPLTWCKITHNFFI